MVQVRFLPWLGNGASVSLDQTCQRYKWRSLRQTSSTMRHDNKLVVSVLQTRRRGQAAAAAAAEPEQQVEETSAPTAQPEDEAVATPEPTTDQANALAGDHSGEQAPEPADSSAPDHVAAADPNAADLDDAAPDGSAAAPGSSPNDAEAVVKDGETAEAVVKDGEDADADDPQRASRSVSRSRSGSARSRSQSAPNSPRSSQSPKRSRSLDKAPDRHASADGARADATGGAEQAEPANGASAKRHRSPDRKSAENEGGKRARDTAAGDEQELHPDDPLRQPPCGTEVRLGFALFALIPRPHVQTFPCDQRPFGVHCSSQVVCIVVLRPCSHGAT